MTSQTMQVGLTNDYEPIVQDVTRAPYTLATTPFAGQTSKTRPAGNRHDQEPGRGPGLFIGK